MTDSFDVFSGYCLQGQMKSSATCRAAGAPEWHNVSPQLLPVPAACRLRIKIHE